MQLEKHSPITIYLMYVIVDREKGDKVMAVMENQKAFFTLALLGKGTATSRMLNYFGLGAGEKTVFMSIMPEHVAEDTMDKLDERLDLGKPGHGVAFATRLHEGCYHKPVQFAADDKGEDEMERKVDHDLILVVVNRGYTEEVMDVARKAGATGGTVLHARGCGLAGAEKFFGVTIQPEKEVILIVAGVDNSCEIMGSIADEAGPGTDASAVSFSLPLATVRGLGGGEC